MYSIYAYWSSERDYENLDEMIFIILTEHFVTTYSEICTWNYLTEKCCEFILNPKVDSLVKYHKKTEKKQNKVNRLKSNELNNSYKRNPRRNLLDLIQFEFVTEWNLTNDDVFTFLKLPSERTDENAFYLHHEK